MYGLINEWTLVFLKILRGLKEVLGFENLKDPPAGRTECGASKNNKIGQFKIIELLRRLILSPLYCNADVMFHLCACVDPLTAI